MSDVQNIFSASTRWLAAIFRQPESAAREFLRENTQASALSTFVRFHAPLLAIFPLAGALCPAVHLGAGRFSLFLHVVAPLVLVLGALAFAVLFDQISRFAQHPRMDGAPDEAKVKNVALFLHLPLSATGVFFFLHPLAGFLMLLVALCYCLWISIETTAALYSSSRARVLVHMINAALLGVAPLALLTLLGNLMRNLRFIKDLL